MISLISSLGLIITWWQIFDCGGIEWSCKFTQVNRSPRRKTFRPTCLTKFVLSCLGWKKMKILWSSWIFVKYGPPKRFLLSEMNVIIERNLKGPAPRIGIELLLLALCLSRILLLYFFKKNPTIRSYSRIGICYIKCYCCTKPIV